MMDLDCVQEWKVGVYAGVINNLTPLAFATLCAVGVVKKSGDNMQRVIINVGNEVLGHSEKDDVSC